MRYQTIKAYNKCSNFVLYYVLGTVSVTRVVTEVQQGRGFPYLSVILGYMTNKRVQIVGCILEYQGKFVLLHRLPHKPDGDTWGLPGGKVDPGETHEQAILRELYEETGYQATPSELECLGTYPFSSPTWSHVTFDYMTYRVRLQQPHTVVLEAHAHSEAMWVTTEQADARTDLIFGLHELFRLVGLL